MRNRILLAFFVLLMAGEVFVAGAQLPDVSATRVKKASEVTPSWTYKGQWTGFVTCNKLQREGNMPTPDQVKQCVSRGGTCVLIAPGGQGQGRLDLAPKAKCDEFAGQQVLITALMTSSRYGTGPTSDAAVAGFASGGDRPASKFQGITILSAKILPKGPPTGRVDTSRMTEASQQ